MNKCSLIVTGLERSWPFEEVKSTSYRGLAYGDPWPLEALQEDDLSEGERRLVQIVYAPFYGAGLPPVTNDLNLTLAFVEYCGRRGISTRILMCCFDRITSRQRGVVQNNQPSNGVEIDNPLPADIAALLLEKSQPLGFDLVTTECEYSPLFDDFCPPENDEFQRYGHQLNGWGLFDTRESAEAYLRFRNSYIEKLRASTHTLPGATLPIEDGVDLAIVGVSYLEKDDVQGMIR